MKGYKPLILLLCLSTIWCNYKLFESSLHQAYIMYDYNSATTYYPLDLVNEIDSDTSFLEMLDQLNEQLIEKGEDCIVFDYDCREGICGTCSLVINGHPHGEKKATTTCQLYMRDYADQTELWIEPWRAKSFPIVKDLAVKREAFDRIIQSGGFISVSVGSAPEANSQLINTISYVDSF